jgi:hypothetical protein
MLDDGPAYGLNLIIKLEQATLIAKILKGSSSAIEK